MLRNEMNQLKDMPKGFDSVGETQRKPKAPVHFSATPASTGAKKEVVIVKGKGEKLSAIPYVADQITSRKSTDKAISTLHYLAFGVPPKRLTVKKNLREFSGIVYGADNNRARMESRLESRATPLLRDLCVLLGVHGGSRADMIKNVADFLEKPAPTDAKVKKASKAKATKATKKGDKKAKATKKGDKKAKGKKAKKADGPKRPCTAYNLFCQAKRAEVVAANKDITPTDIMKKLGEMWHVADAATKKPFEAAAAQDKKRYEAECKKKN